MSRSPHLQKEDKIFGEKYVRLPIASPLLSAEGRVIHGESVTEGMNGKAANGALVVLYVEDDDDDAIFFDRAAQLTGQRVEVRRVRDESEAKLYLSSLGLYRDSQRFPKPHVIVGDLRLRYGSDVLDLVEWIRAQPEFKTMPFFVFSSPDDKEQKDAARCLASGANAYFAKPWDIRLWPETVGAMIGQAIHSNA